MRTSSMTGPLSQGPDTPERLIAAKHSEYFRAAKRYRMLYYTSRLCAGLSAGLLPFVVKSSSTAAVFLSVLTVVAVVFDSVFTPKDRWALYAKATDLLAAAQLKAAGQYQQWKLALKTIEQTESAMLRELVDIQELIEHRNHETERD